MFIQKFLRDLRYFREAPGSVTILSATFNQIEMKMICGRKHVLKFYSTVIEIHSVCTKLSK